MLQLHFHAKDTAASGLLQCIASHKEVTQVTIGWETSMEGSLRGPMTER